MTERSPGEELTARQQTNGDANGLPQEFLEEWRNVAYNCFSSGHKFCREVCPVMQVTRDERHTPTAFHANVVAMEKGHLTIEDVADDYVNCTQCGACELRCPNTLFTGDFYRFRRARSTSSRRCARSPSARHPPAGLEALDRADRPLGQRAGARLDARDLGQQVRRLGGRPRHPGRRRDDALRRLRGGVLPPVGAARGRAAAARRRRRVRADGASSGAAAGRCGRWATSTSRTRFAEHNMLDWRKTGTKRILVPRPARLHHVHRALPGARRELRRVRDRARGRPGRRADPRRDGSS